MSEYAVRSAFRAERFLFLLFCLTLFWAPLPFGSNRPWAVAFLCLVLSAIAAAWLVLHRFRLVELPVRVVRRMRLPLAILVVICLWVFVQTVPLPGFLVELFSPRGSRLHVLDGWMPLSLDIAHTRIYLLNSVACAAAFFLVLALVNCEKRACILLWVLVASGTFQAVYGALMVLTGLEWGFLVKKYSGIGNATGTFVNRNHLAGYLVICLAVGTGLLLSRMSTTPYENWKDFARRTLRLLLSRKVLLRIFLAIMVIALVLTRSRMGNTAFFASLGGAGLIAVIMGRTFSPRLVLLLASIFVIDIWIVGQWFGFDKVVERLEKAAPAAEQRLIVSGETTSILEDFPLAGSGGGSFYSVYTYYQSSAGGRTQYHAHNDYLEIAAELGIPALLLLGLLCVLVLARAVRMQQTDHSRLQRGVGFTLVMILIWLAIHSTVDFNLQIPANNVTLCAILALAFARLLPLNRDNGDTGGKFANAAGPATQ